MANFPYREPDIARLAHDLSSGLTANRDLFPSPPVPPEEIERALAAYNSARDASIVAAANAVQGTAAKDQTLAALVELMKNNLRYAESTARNDNGKLQLIGWGAPRSRTVTGIPGQVRTLEVVREGKNWVFLDWKEPTDGGQVGAYRVQRRRRDGGDWIDVGMAIESEVTLNGQDGGIEFEYQVLAVNKTGEGPASNIVRAIL